MRKLTRQVRPELVGITKKVERRERNREIKALKASHIQDQIQNELLARLQQGLSTETIANVPQNIYDRVLDLEEQQQEEQEQELEEEQDQDEENVQDIYVEGDQDEDDIEDDIEDVGDTMLELGQAANHLDHNDPDTSVDLFTSVEPSTPSSSLRSNNGHPSRQRNRYRDNNHAKTTGPSIEEQTKENHIEVEYEQENETQVN